MSAGSQIAPDSWEKPQNILVILAHPDDPEFFCGATLARWAKAGHAIDYYLLTNGDKGGGPEVTPEQLVPLRQAEQQKAAAIIGARSVVFLDKEDGYLVPNLELRREMVRLIRREKPDILVTCDPTLLYSWFGRVNHPDHRAAGQVVLDAVFPAAGNSHFFPELLTKEGLQPHTPREVWVSLAASPTVTLDVTGTWEVKMNALKEHKSQIGDPILFEQRMRSRRTEDSSDVAPRYEEYFRVLKFA
ncbi:MAG TPA: PIG-L deacetylase family protein [Anaerolineales bacterium]